MVSIDSINKILVSFERNDNPAIQPDMPMDQQVLFIAKHMNWGLHSESDWQSNTWVVFRDGTVFSG